MKRVVFLGTKDLNLRVHSRFEFFVGHQNGAIFKNDKIMNDLYIPKMVQLRYDLITDQK